MAIRENETNSAVHSSLHPVAGETPRCALSEDGQIVYANDAFFALTGLESVLQERANAFDVFQFADERLVVLKNLKEVPSGAHDILLKNTNAPAAFHFNWVDAPDQSRYLIASAIEGAEKGLAPDSLDTILQGIAKAPHRPQKQGAPPALITDLHDLLAFSALSHDLMIITDQQGSILKANQAFYSALGYAPEDLVSRTFTTLLHEEDRALVQNSIKTPAKTEARLISHNGDAHWIAWECRKAENCIYFSGRDITDIKSQHDDLLRRQKQLSEAEAIGRMGHWHWPVGQDDIEWSEEIYRIFGREPDTFSPSIQSMSDMVHEEDVERLIQIFQRAVIEKKNYDMEFRITQPNGDMRYILCEGRCEKDADGDVTALYGIMQDMTERLLYEQQLRSAMEASEQAYTAKSRFLANMSHELRTPLNAIIGFSEMMGNQVYGPLGHKKYVEYATDIHDSGALLLDLIGDILDMSKIEAGKYELDLSEVHLADVIARAKTMVNSRAEQGGITLQTDGTACGGLIFVADRRALVQIFLNLLSNAIKFTRPGGTVTLSCEKKKPHCILRVTDTGVGIPPNKLAAVLNPFEQVSSSYTRDHEGSGLGLSITRELVEMHGGTLRIDSKVGVGTTVSVRLPYKAKIKTER